MRLELQGNDSICKLISKLSDKEGIPWNQCGLINPKGPSMGDIKMLEDTWWRTLVDYNLQNGDVLYLRLRLRGGGGTIPAFIDLRAALHEIVVRRHKDEPVQPPFYEPF